MIFMHVYIILTVGFSSVIEITYFSFIFYINCCEHYDLGSNNTQIKDMYLESGIAYLGKSIWKSWIHSSCSLPVKDCPLNSNYWLHSTRILNTKKDNSSIHGAHDIEKILLLFTAIIDGKVSCLMKQSQQNKWDSHVKVFLFDLTFWSQGSKTCFQAKQLQ